MNPFRKSPTPLRARDSSRWVRIDSIWEKLNELVERDENTVILGVEGSGKTSLLNMFFNPEYCAKAAMQGKLVFFADPSNTKDGDDLCRHLIMQLQRAVEKNLPSEIAGFEQFLEKIKTESKKRQFILACEYLYDQGFMLLMVMDRFEQFVSSDHITQEQHDMLRSMLDKDVMRCVVATNYDLQQSSLPEAIVGSMYLQKFQQKITMPGFSPEEAKRFISKRIPADSPIQIDDKKVKYLYNLTGGIPLLFEQAACLMYDLLERGSRIVNNEFRTMLLNEVRPTLHHWFKVFPQEYVDVSKVALGDVPNASSINAFRIPMEDPNRYAAAARLRDRGLFVNTRQNMPNLYACNSLLLQVYLINEYLPNIQTAVTSPKAEKKRKPYNVFISYKRTFEGAATKDAEIALAVYERLRAEKQFVPFLDVKEMPYGIGKSDFWDTIYAALETAQVYIFIATQSDFVSAPCVATEWKTYTEEMAAGRKPHGSVYGVIDNVEILDIPLRLRHGVEMLPNTSEGLDRLVVYLQNQFNKEE